MGISERSSPATLNSRAANVGSAHRAYVSKKWRRVLIWGVFVLALLTVGVVGERITPLKPLGVSPIDRLKAPGTVLSNSAVTLLGTDGVGRDALSRIIAGARLSLLIAIGSVLVAGAFGTSMGLVAGYFGGRLGDVIMRLVDIQMAFPSILLALAIAAALGPSVLNLILALGFSYWTSYARLSRSSVLAINELEFITGARVTGASDLRILFRHILPNASNPIMILATLHLGQMIIAEASLSYLGLGIQPPDISWGSMIANGRDYLGNAWWAATFPGLAIALTVLIMGLFGDAVRDALDPKFHFDRMT